jgi:undecaprenyl-diphosphatase
VKSSTITLIVIQLAAFLLLAIFNPLLEPLNQWARHLIERKRVLRLRPLMILSHRYNNVASVSIQLLLFAVIVGLCWRDWRRASLLPLAIFIQISLIMIIKKLTSVNRPPQDLTHVFMNSGSFPSGHSTASMTFALMVPSILAPYVPLALIVVVSTYLAAVALITAYGRLFLNVHWLTDIIGGWLLSGATCLLCNGFIIR